MNIIKERGILFAADMIRATLENRKTQTRRICKPMNSWVDQKCREVRQVDGHPHHFLLGAEEPLERLYCPHGQPGDRLWVRETHRPIFGQSGGLIAIDYKADPREKWERMGDDPNSLVKPTKWIPSIHMRREYSRIDLEITDVRVERLNDISEADCIAEGCPDEYLLGKNWYRDLWESLNGPGSWDLNPWVWVIDYRRVDQ